MSKYILPKGRIPKAFNQDIENPKTNVGSCGACTFTKILEVINYVKTGEYTMLSKGYMYGRNNYPGKKNPGMMDEYTLDVLLTRGTVPEKMCSDYAEIPEITKILEKRDDILILDKEAESYKLKSWENISGNNSQTLFNNVIAYLTKYEMPLAGTIKKYKGEKHSVVIVGYDDDGYVYFHNHTGKDDLEKVKYDRFQYAYYLDGGIETMANYKSFKIEEFKKYMDSITVTRKIVRVQLHHTYSPSYTHFKGDNHVSLQNGMRNYHMNTNGWDDIAQHFTIFPDGVIMTGRSLNVTPIGIKGANTGAICIECVGNFDKGGDVMSDAQKNAIVGAVKILLDKFNLTAEKGVTYHAWWSSDGKDLGDYIKSHSVKTCPGTNFFGGNGLTAYEKNLMPLIKSYGKKEEKVMLETGNDIVWELMNGKHKIEITEVQRAIKAIDDAKNNADFSSLYWILYKLVNNR